MNRIAAALIGVGCCAFAIYKASKNKGTSEPMKPPKYSIEWIKSLSSIDWEHEREIVRQQYCDPKLDISFRSRLWNILYLFDKVKSERDWAGKTPSGYKIPREHGWNLFKPD